MDFVTVAVALEWNLLRKPKHAVKGSLREDVACR